MLKISAISYLNTIPFIYGIEKSGILKNYKLEMDVPSVGAAKLINGSFDIGLVPVAILNELKEYHILTDYCIGGVGKINSVILLSQKPVHEISTIFLDTDSRTSVELVKVLAKHFWKIDPEWKKISFDGNTVLPESIVAIGDKTFELRDKFQYIYDLGEEWFRFTSLPFVFACWISTKKIENDVLEKFNKAIAFGVENKFKAVTELTKKFKTNEMEYIEKYISYELDEQKRLGLERFLKYLNPGSSF